MEKIQTDISTNPPTEGSENTNPSLTESVLQIRLLERKQNKANKNPANKWCFSKLPVLSALIPFSKIAAENVLVWFSHGASELEDNFNTASLTLIVRGQDEVQRGQWTSSRP